MISIFQNISLDISHPVDYNIWVLKTMENIDLKVQGIQYHFKNV